MLPGVDVRAGTLVSSEAAAGHEWLSPDGCDGALAGGRRRESEGVRSGGRTERARHTTEVDVAATDQSGAHKPEYSI